MRSSPSARRRRSPACRRTRRRGRSERAARDRLRHHGRRHRDELRQRRHPGDGARDDAGRRSTEGLAIVPRATGRRRRSKGRMTPQQVEAADGAAQPTLRLRRPRPTPTS
ncbi:MAG: hypothetical protein MZW92_48635 [Comamonadaceae bacterium]|nr:hypothetical protein [Comamonadaceae bacterium]